MEITLLYRLYHSEFLNKSAGSKRFIVFNSQIEKKELLPHKVTTLRIRSLILTLSFIYSHAVYADFQSVQQLIYRPFESWHLPVHLLATSFLHYLRMCLQEMHSLYGYRKGIQIQTWPGKRHPCFSYLPGY